MKMANGLGMKTAPFVSSLADNVTTTNQAQHYGPDVSTLYSPPENLCYIVVETAGY